MTCLLAEPPSNEAEVWFSPHCLAFLHRLSFPWQAPDFNRASVEQTMRQMTSTPWGDLPLYFLKNHRLV